MGCWNGTCGLSGLPIINGEEIYVFPIVESYRDSFCYSTALYRPSVVPFRAKYNDYGGGEECNGPALNLLIDGIRKQLVEMEVGKNQFHDIAVKREGFDVDMFFDACHEKRLRFLNPLRGYENQPQTRDVFFTMVRKDVVDRLWNEWKFDMYIGTDGIAPKGFERDKYYIKNITYTKLAELIPEYMEQEATSQLSPIRMKQLERYNDENIRKEMELFYREDNMFKSFDDHILSRTFRHSLGGSYSDGYNNIGDIKDEILKKYFDGDKEAAYELLREVMITVMINDFMNHTRRIWLPPMHQGSQSECYAEYRLMNKITEDVMTAREKEYGWDEEDERYL